MNKALGDQVKAVVEHYERNEANKDSKVGLLLLIVESSEKESDIFAV